MNGFTSPGVVPRPSTPIDDTTRARLMRVLVAIDLQLPPEQIGEALTSGSGFPDVVERTLQRQHVEGEMADYVDVFLYALENPKA